MVDAYDRLSADSADSFALRCSHEFIPFTLVLQAIVSRLLVNLLGILGERVPGSPSLDLTVHHICLSALSLRMQRIDRQSTTASRPLTSMLRGRVRL